ncbi:MAG: SdrD B-like domain-containing protein [Candidatus Nanopelagicales bacterium]
MAHRAKPLALGDMELLCDPAPIQVGNRVWKDSDSDGIQDANESGFAAIQVQLIQGASAVATTTTDANGNYYFSNLTPNSAYTVRILTTQSALTGWGNSPANASDGAHAANSSNSAFTDTVDSDYSVSGSNANITFTTGAAGFNNHSFDFGFTPPVPPVIDLNVRKSSSANGGPVVAGDTITYTMVITSSSAITQTGLSISDTLPAGTSYVPNSLRVTGYYTFTARDDFSAGANYSGGSGWSSNWVEENDDGSPTTGKIFAFLSCPTLNSNCLAFEANPTIANTIRRDVDLSNSITATFSVVGVGNPPVRTVTLAMADSTGGVVQQTLGQLTNSTLQTISVGIPSQFYISTARLRATGAAGSVSYNLTDNYLISGVKITTTAPATGLPAILSVPNNFLINSQYPMTVTYAVVVNTPVPASVGAIVNTVAVTSTVNTLAKTSTVTDTLSGQKIGNYVWLDTNQDGIQDSSDQPLSGVQVWLTDLSGNILSTTTTSATGEYYFIAPTLGAGVTYQVMLPLTQTALLNYQPTVQDAGTDDTADSDGNATMIADRLLIQLTSPTPGNYNFTYDFGFIPRIFDWGDLPEPKFNTDITGTVGARHEIVDGLRIGNSVDSENSGQPNSTATGDGSDEDGVTIPALAPGASSVVQVIVQNTLAASATLYGFIDFNNDGTFSASETVTALVPSGTTGLIPLTFNVPGGSPTGVDIGARFRLSSDTTLSADGPTLSQLAPNGEVEDYIIRLVNPDRYG